ncbi:glycerate kinase [Nibrella saemangeumensis]|uniref:Glycerate kinase n=1 Tax=Nibrella saemangeumensis TaxID=1084526 RepID=A0ABP8MXU8_9BACT
MKLLLAPDKFRGSLTARQVCDAMTEGIRLVKPDAEIVALPLADGGEGTAEVLTDATNGHWHTVPVLDPLGRSIQAGFGVSADGQTAFVEMAQASGLRLLDRSEYNPMQTSTFGTGQLIQQAVAMGVQHIVLGIGGSATNDAGIGLAAALGWQFLDQHGQTLTPCGAALQQIRSIKAPISSLLPDNLTVSVACDVTNPLYGPNGAAAIYGPQKGASPAIVAELDAGLHHFAEVIKQQFGTDLAQVPGAGAAGGLGAGALFFLNAELKEGVRLIMHEVQFDQHLAGSHLVLTGEGKTDRQTLQGKLLKGIADRANASGIPVVALCGTLELTPEEVAATGLTAAFSILNRPQLLDEALQHAYTDVRQATFHICRLFLQR